MFSFLLIFVGLSTGWQKTVEVINKKIEKEINRIKFMDNCWLDPHGKAKTIVTFAPV
jgi:hypothetical protein